MAIPYKGSEIILYRPSENILNTNVRISIGIILFTIKSMSSLILIIVFKKIKLKIKIEAYDKRINLEIDVTS